MSAELQINKSTHLDSGHQVIKKCLVCSLKTDANIINQVKTNEKNLSRFISNSIYDHNIENVHKLEFLNSLYPKVMDSQYFTRNYKYGHL